MVAVKEIMTTKVISLSTEDFISTAIAKMSDHGMHHILVVDDGGKYVGMMDYNLLFKRGSIPVTTKVKTVMERTTSISENSSIIEAARVMLDSGVRALPVIEKNVIKGIVTSTDIVHAVNSIPEVSNSVAGDIMSGEPITVSEDDELSGALRKMREIDEMSIPVVNKAGKLTGMVNINDISKELWRERGRMRQGEYYRNKGNVRVKDVMVAPSLIKPDKKLSSCMDEMMKTDARICTVVDENMIPEGIISQIDILGEIVKGSSTKSVLVNISGAKFEDPDIYNRIYMIIEKAANAIARFKRMKPMLINIHIEEYNQKGKEIKYSIRGKMITESKTFYTRAWDWNIFSAVKDLMSQFEKMAHKDKDHR